MEFIQRLTGAVPIYGSIASGLASLDRTERNLSYAFGKKDLLSRSEKERNILSKITDYTSWLQKVPYKTAAVGDKILQKRLSEIGKITSKVNIALTAIDFGEFFVDRGY